MSFAAANASAFMFSLMNYVKQAPAPNSLETTSEPALSSTTVVPLTTLDVPTQGATTETTAGILSWEFLEKFLTSAGFGGLMAVVAACIAAFLAYRQLKHARAAISDSRWWDTLKWVYDKSVVEKDTVTPLPQKVTFSILDALQKDEVPDGYAPELRFETISSILTLFVEPDDDLTVVRDTSSASVPDEEVSPARTTSTADSYLDVINAPQANRSKWSDVWPSSITVNDPEAADLLEQLRNTLAHRGFGDVVISAQQFETNVGAALDRVLSNESGVSVTRSSNLAGVGFDFEIRRKIDGLVILIVVKYYRKVLIPSSLAQAAHEVRRTGAFPKGDRPGGAIIVSNQNVTRNAATKLAEIGEGKVLHVRWNEKDDDVRLAAAIHRLGFGPAIGESRPAAPTPQ